MTYQMLIWSPSPLPTLLSVMRRVLVHSGGHCFPQKAAEVEAIRAFLQQFVSRAPSTSSLKGGVDVGFSAPINNGTIPETACLSVPSANAGFEPLTTAETSSAAATSDTKSSLHSGRPPPRVAPDAMITPATLLHIAPASVPPSVAAVPYFSLLSEPTGGFPAPDEQLEEIEALAAIFGEEYECLCGDNSSEPGNNPAVLSTPIRFRIMLREPGSGSEPAVASTSRSLSHTSSLVFTFPQVCAYTFKIPVRFNTYNDFEQCFMLIIYLAGCPVYPNIMTTPCGAF